MVGISKQILEYSPCGGPGPDPGVYCGWLKIIKAAVRLPTASETGLILEHPVTAAGKAGLI